MTRNHGRGKRTGTIVRRHNGVSGSTCKISEKTDKMLKLMGTASL